MPITLSPGSLHEFLSRAGLQDLAEVEWRHVSLRDQWPGCQSSRRIQRTARPEVIFPLSNLLLLGAELLAVFPTNDAAKRFVLDWHQRAARVLTRFPAVCAGTLGSL